MVNFWLATPNTIEMQSKCVADVCGQSLRLLTMEHGQERTIKSYLAVGLRRYVAPLSRGRFCLPPCNAARVYSRCRLLNPDQTSPHKSLKRQPNCREDCYSEKFVFMPSVVVSLGGPAMPLPPFAKAGSNNVQYLNLAVRLAEAGRFYPPIAPPSLFKLQPRWFCLIHNT